MCDNNNTLPHEWVKKPIHWEDKKNHYISFVFSWDLWEWCQVAQPELNEKQIVVGGPAVLLNKEWIPEWVKIGEPLEGILNRHYICATRTTIGCIRKCPFCAVPKIEGEFRELETWNNKTVLIDNNLLAASRKHFVRVIDSLKQLTWCDFSQGLDSRLLTKWHAERLAELKHPVIRLAWDHISYESAFFRACELLEKQGIPKRRITVYVLIGFRDTPEDALYRLNAVHQKGYMVFPMRFQPLNSKRRNEFVGENWTDSELTRYMKYWSSRRFFSGIPFSEFDYGKFRREGNVSAARIF